MISPNIRSPRQGACGRLLNQKEAIAVDEDRLNSLGMLRCCFQDQHGVWLVGNHLETIGKELGPRHDNYGYKYNS